MGGLTFVLTRVDDLMHQSWASTRRSFPITDCLLCHRFIAGGVCDDLILPTKKRAYCIWPPSYSLLLDILCIKEPILWSQEDKKIARSSPPGTERDRDGSSKVPHFTDGDIIGSYSKVGYPHVHVQKYQAQGGASGTVAAASEVTRGDSEDD